MEETPVPIYNIKMVGPGIELVLRALGGLPHNDVRGLYDEIAGQYLHQKQQFDTAAATAAAGAVPELTMPDEPEVLPG